MKKGLFFIFGLIFITAGFASAQTARKTVTNADLDKFRQKRLAAERDYRENYARKGFPSPEELEERHEQERKDLSARSARMEQENYAREQQRREELYYQEQSQAYNNYNNQAAYNINDSYTGYGNSGYGYGGYGYSNGFYGNRLFRGGQRFGTLTPGTPFSSLGGVQINTNGVRISTGRGFRGGFVNNGGGVRSGGIRGGGGVRSSGGGGRSPR